MSNEKVGSLEEQALKRKERLQALKRRRDGEVGESSKPPEEHTEALPKPKFRSYKPQDDKLKAHAVPEAKPADVESQIKDQLGAAKSKVVMDELDITNLAPRKPDWDLKRDVAKKLKQLERMTQRAIGELIRERLKQKEEDAEADGDASNE